ncbi:hypothetical protein [Oscillatoria acuminata]|uniref:Uncharacterized protein n=1 Tax=Oscillatoria acuminata PCC 6304 TaxID=56110 RepID=K9TBA8_9CYAN|nr:hypothetical protein [Oscillatoria acuminata]AFY80187.1 hypothetical protein Oscil6304_0439 [Oscillatoria acuminata PCC 6304]
MKSLWPRWLPYPVSIVRATVVCGVFFLFIRLVASSIQEEVLYWYYYGGGIPDSLIGATFLGWIIILPVVAFLHHWISGVFEERYYQNHHPFIPSWKSCWEGVTALLVATFGFIIVGLVLPSSALRIFWIVSGLWFISMAYLYHIGYLFREWRLVRKAINAERKAARRKANEEARAAKERAKAEKKALKSRRQPAIAPSTETVFDDMLKAIAEKEKRGRRR